MIRTAYLIVFYLFTMQWGVSQPTVQWQKTFGGSYFDEAFSVQNTTDGGYIVAGTTLSLNGDVLNNHGGADCWVIKLNAAGQLEWKKEYGGTMNDEGRSIIQTNDGGYLVCGFSASNNGDVLGNHGGAFDGWVIKLNSNGVKQWQKAIGGSQKDEFRDVMQTEDGGYILVGKSDSQDGDIAENNGLWDVLVVKLNSTGQLEWEKTYGGSENDEARGVNSTSDGGFVVVGRTSSNDGDVEQNNGNADMWVLKLNHIGELEWEETYGGNAADIAQDVVQTQDGGFIVGGYSGSHNSGDVSGHDELGSFDFWIVKITANGILEWQKALGGTEPDYAQSIIITNDGNYLVLGDAASANGELTGNLNGTQFWLTKLSKTGELIWQYAYGGSEADVGYSVSNTSDGGYIMAGYTWSTDGDAAGANYHGYNDFWIVKLSPETTSAASASEAESLKLYPNPCGSSVMLEIPEAGELKIILTDISGKIVLTKKVSGNQEQLNLSNLPRGVYLMRAGKWAEIVYKTE